MYSSCIPNNQYNSLNSNEGGRKEWTPQRSFLTLYVQHDTHSPKTQNKNTQTLDKIHRSEYIIYVYYYSCIF